jgi:Big-like domain-containing protein
VVGRPTTIGAVTYLQAMTVSLGSPPKPTADAAPPAPPPARPKVPPVVVFSLPLDGDREVPATGRFAVQFSKDMNEESFKGRVLLRYAGRPQPGDRDFDAARITYDGGRRALIVDPADVLGSGRVVELILLPGIVDTDGMALETRPGRMAGQFAEVLRYQVGLN